VSPRVNDAPRKVLNLREIAGRQKGAETLRSSTEQTAESNQKWDWIPRFRETPRFYWRKRLAEGIAEGDF